MRIRATLSGGDTVEGEVRSVRLESGEFSVTVHADGDTLPGDSGAADITMRQLETLVAPAMASEVDSWEGESSGVDAEDLAELAAIAGELMTPLAPRPETPARNRPATPSGTASRRATLRNRIAETLGGSG